MGLPPSLFPHDISKTDAARITKLDKEMFHDESWKPIYFGVKRSTTVKVMSHKNIAGEGLCTLVSAGFFAPVFGNKIECCFDKVDR